MLQRAGGPTVAAAVTALIAALIVTTAKPGPRHPRRARPGLIPAGLVLWVAVAGGQTPTTTVAMVAQFEPAGAAQPNFCTGTRSG